MELRSADFAAFFRAVHGHYPFPWQQRLVDHLARCDEWPDALNLPTGAGKTAALDAAVFHLALRADAPGKAALRIALVVDRRLVVDDAFARAKKIARTLSDSLRGDAISHESVKEVAGRLRRLAGGEDAPPLIVQRLRGGAPLEHDWARTPTQPTILCSTVDQVGSRLLFRGYGVSDRMKPIHAGLLGVDSLLLLDEAHLSEPFRQTLAAVRKIGNAGVRVALLSATLGASASDALGLSQDDRSHPVLKRRLEARKPAACHATRHVVRGELAEAVRRFADDARAMADRLRKKGVSPVAVGVVVNRVDLARGIYENLDEKQRGDESADSGATDTLLLIGRSRSVDRDEIAHRLAPFRTDAQDRADARPVFIVATQCLEVGVDLDLDGLVTQAASLDALLQRFGRLNRAGRKISAEGVILARSEDIAKKADDPVYGNRIRKTWEALCGVAEDGCVDLRAEVLSARLKEMGMDPNDLAAERPNAPVVMPSYLHLWSQTWPRPTADPDVGLFLHGVERTTAGVSVIWRSDISETDLTGAKKADLEQLIRLVPPRAAEAVDIPIWTARRWLRMDRAGLASLSDVPAREDEAPTVRRQAEERCAFRWAGAGDPRTGIVKPEDLRTGDVVIVPAGYGGCDKFGWAPDAEAPVKDVADEAAEPYWGRRCAVRIAYDCVRTSAHWDRLSAILADESIDGTDLVESLIQALPSTAAREEGEEGGNGPPPRDVTKPLMALRCTEGRIDVYFPYGAERKDGAVLVAERGIKGRSAMDLAFPATEDENASHTSGEPVPLDEHGLHVADFAERFVQMLGLDDVASDLRLAAFLHDAGKADSRFQTMLSGGDPWNRPDGPPLAKSGRSWSPDAWKRAGLPKGWRHEALSVQMALAHPRFSAAHDPALVLWLIGTHHGFGRPFFDFFDSVSRHELPPCLDVTNWRLDAETPGPQSPAFEFQSVDWPSMFEGLKRRYGIWQLAHLEAILRLADHRASEEERAS